MSANYITSAELARRCDVSRAAVALAIKEHRIDPAKVRRAGGRVLVEEQHGLSVLGHHRKRKPSPSPVPAPAADLADLGDLMAWGCGSFDADEDDAPLVATPAPAADLARLHHQLERVKAREQRWVTSYKKFREWFAGWVPVDNFQGELWRKLGADTPGVIDVSVEAREMVIKRLNELDECDLASRFPGANG